MNKELIGKLQGQLEASKDALQKELETFAVEDKNMKGNWDTKPIGAEDADLEEKGDEATEYENLVSLEHNLELRLKAVNAALEKITAGNYGTCEKCGKDIEEERLMAMPEARTCMSCNK